LTTITGALIQTEFDSDLTVATLEVIIDSAVDDVNSDAGTNIGYMTGGAGSKTMTVTGNQAVAIKAKIALKLADRAVSGGSSSSNSLGFISESQSVSSSPSSVNADQYERAIRKLVGIGFRRA